MYLLSNTSLQSLSVVAFQTLYLGRFYVADDARVFFSMTHKKCIKKTHFLGSKHSKFKKTFFFLCFFGVLALNFRLKKCFCFEIFKIFQIEPPKFLSIFVEHCRQ